MMRFDEYYDVVIVGTGAAGLYCALNFPKRYKVLLLTKQKADECDSFLAQGGICMQHGEADYRSFFEDTMRAGHYENDAATVDLMIRSSNSIIRDLVRRGVRFARDENGALRFTREGAHSRARILFHEDVTGREITQTLLAEALRCENIELRENTVMLDFFADAAACGGVVAMGPDSAVRAIGAGAVVLACGGIGGLYKNSTNYPHITGDAIAMALRHGVDLEHHRALMPTYGGYSGQYIRPIALATIATLKQTTGFPICGCGGINSAHDALEFIMLGAQSVQLASVLLRDSYEAIPRILGDLERWLEDHGYYSIEEVCGLALGSLQAFEELPPRPLTAHLTGGCNGCGKCVSSCLYGAMTMEAGKIVLDAARCTGCGMCEAICPENALELRW